MKKILVLCSLILFLIALPLQAQITKTEDFAVSPVTNAGKPWRIAYCENDPYVNFAGFFYGVVKGLDRMGWINSIEGIPYEIGSDNAKVMWEWLVSKNKENKYIEFVEDGFYPLISMTEKEKEEFVTRLTQKRDIDLIIVMGTKAGQFVSSTVKNVPIILLSTTNSVKSGITASIEDSGQDNLWSLIDPDAYIRQLQVFHDLFNFKKLGIVYEDSELGRSMSAVDDVYKFAHEKGIEVVESHVDEAVSSDDLERYDRELMQAYWEIAPQVDAFYLTPGSRASIRTSEYLEPFYEHKVPVFNMEGIADVENGALMTVQRQSFDDGGGFGADRIARVFNGALPRQLEQRFVEIPSISINMAVAEKIGFQVPFEILLAADEIYTHIRTE